MIEGKRKYTITLIFVATACALVIFKGLNPEEWIKYTAYVVLGYFGGNSAEHLIKSKK